MNGLAIAIAVAILLPLALALALIRPLWRGRVLRLIPLAPVPALILGIVAPEGTVESGRLMTGLRFGLDPLAGGFAVFTALIWIAASAHMLTGGMRTDTPRERLFLFCFLTSMSGNLGLVFALESLTFFLFFSMMSLAAYGVIVNNDAPNTRFAGRLYLALALFGEMLVLAGLMFGARGLFGAAYAWLLYWGFGVKHGVLPLHVWLPVAHGTAPVPASALLSGAMLKAGVLGWLRFLPEAEVALADLAGPAIVLGLGAAFFGAALGCLQHKAKMVLGYSSVSQMGILTAAVGAGAAESVLWPAVVPIILLFCLHHGLVKAGLFLGVGVNRDGVLGRWVYPMLVLLSLAIAAAPLTGGAWFKLWLEEVLPKGPEGVLAVVALLLPWTSVASTLLMARFLWLARVPAEAHPEDPAGGRARPLPQLLLGVAGLVAPWWLVAQSEPELLAEMFTGTALWKTLWPVLLGAVPAALLAVLAARGRLRLTWGVPPGDVALVFTRIPRPRLPGRSRPALPGRVTEAGGRLEAVEARLLNLSTAGLFYVALVLAISLLLIL